VQSPQAKQKLSQKTKTIVCNVLETSKNNISPSSTAVVVSNPEVTQPLEVPVSSVNVASSDSDSDVELDMTRVSGRLQYIIGRPVAKNAQKLPMLLDNGAEVNLIDSSVIDSMRVKPKRVKNVGIQSISEDSLHCTGFVNLPVVLGKLTVNVPFFVINNLPYSSIISVQFLQDKGAIIDYRRRVLDFYMNDRYSGPLPLFYEEQFNFQTLAKVRVSCTNLVASFSCNSVVACDLVVPSDNVLSCALSHQDTRVSFRTLDTIHLVPESVLKISLPLEYSSVNYVDKSIGPKGLNVDIRIVNNVEHKAHVLVIHNESKTPVTIDKGTWILTALFRDAVQPHRSKYKPPPPTVPIYTYSKSASENFECKPDIEDYVYTTYPQAIADGFSHEEIGTIKCNFREKTSIFQISLLAKI